MRSSFITCLLYFILNSMFNSNVRCKLKVRLDRLSELLSVDYHQKICMKEKDAIFRRKKISLPDDFQISAMLSFIRAVDEAG